MSENISKSLEVGLGLLLFIMGLSTFLVTNKSLETYLLVGEENTSNHVGVLVSTNSIETYITAQEIFYHLTHMTQTKEKIYIDNVYLPYTTDKASEEELIDVLKVFGNTKFYKNDVIDEHGKYKKIVFVPIE